MNFARFTQNCLLGAGAVCEGERRVTVMADGEIRYRPEYRVLVCRVRDIRAEVNEYMSMLYLLIEISTTHYN
jgi:hypothetical protein